MMGNIFNKYFLSDFIGAYRKELQDRIDKLEVIDTTDLEGLIHSLKIEFTIEPIVIGEPRPSEPREITRQLKNVWNENYQQKVFEINVVIPFEGNHELFYCRPSETIIVYLDKGVIINSSNVSAKIILESLDEKSYHNEVSKIIGTLKSNLPRVNSELVPWNNGLDSLIKQLIESRKGVVSKKIDFMEKIGLKVNPQSTEFLIPPTVTKKAIPTPVTETSKNVKKEAIPILQDEVYKDIKEVLYNVGKALERKPSIYSGKHEEDLRDIFLLFLETRYDSTTGIGEAFNRNGKTDILLKYAKDGTNLFVAECKFWKGQKNFLESIDQLLGYLTHRDSKTALIIFVDQKELTTIVSTIKEEIKKHKNFQKYIKDTYDHSISYEFNLPQDTKRTIKIEVILFHFPD